MKQKRNKFFTFVLSCFPGAGQMFLGFMKTGLSLMVMFFGVIFLSSALNLYELNYLLPIIWFYSFFDAINREWSSDADFADMQDSYLVSQSALSTINNAFHGKGKLIFGIVLVLVGLKALWDTVFSNITEYFGVEATHIINTFSDVMPRLVIAAIIIVLGIYLIISKKRSSESK